MKGRDRARRSRRSQSDTQPGELRVDEYVRRGGSGRASRTAEAAELVPDIAYWQPVLQRLSLSLDEAAVHAIAARLNGSSLDRELVVSGAAGEAELYAAIARALGVKPIESIDPDRLVIREDQCLPMLQKAHGFRMVNVEEEHGRTVYALSPEGMSLADLAAMFERQPESVRRVKIATPSLMRETLLRRARPTLAATARNGLFDRFSELSARFVMRGWQGTILGALLVLLPFSAVLAPDATTVAVHSAATIFFFACVTLRFAAVWARPAPPIVDLRPTSGAGPPVYSILVALHREAEVVGQLVSALDRIVWPRSRLDIKLVCEADDASTLAAIAALNLPPHFQVLEVPAGQPRTKPKALAYALQSVRGEFVVLYDAEDRPHPLQLVEAWGRFSAAPRDLACLQAPLEIANPRAGILARMFAFEYIGLFRGLLPWLAERELVLPLGGTSNHFRVSSLEDVGGWDPYNVTEDADLGFRLARFGYCNAQVQVAPT